MINPQHKSQRESDLAKIKSSKHPRKVVVAGPGTGKSYLFRELIKQRRMEGKTNFLAITFIGKLGDALADDLCGLATTTTLHSFARGFVLKHCKGWNYYPQIHEIITEDLQAEGITEFHIGDDNYARKTKFYRAVGDADVVCYAAQICKKDPEKIPIFDLILVDEYQDFNRLESDFVDVLAQKNEMVIVGDDDQALYAFKGSSADFIREKYGADNKNFESHTLRFCSRCPEVLIRYFHALVKHFKLDEPTKGRIPKEYICYTPDKDEDSCANPGVHVVRDCPPGMIAYKVRTALEELVTSQKVKEVLIIGEGRSCASLLNQVARQLRNYGFANVTFRGDSGLLPVDQKIVNAYRFLADDEASLLGWRILGNPKDAGTRTKHLDNARLLAKIIDGTPSEIEKLKAARLAGLEEEIERWEQEKGLDPEQLRHYQNEQIRRATLVRELKSASVYLPRPLRNLEINVCNILNSKGLGADVVFLIGFDNGRFPVKQRPTESEIYQMLVAITRGKKRLYLINTIGKRISGFIDCLSAKDRVDE